MISTILLSGGIGSRSGQNMPKQYCDLKGKMIIKYCLDEIIKAGLTDELIIVYGNGFIDLIRDLVLDYSNVFTSINYVVGGASRQESVYNGLKLCSYKTVVLHESSRPLITAADLKKIIDHPSENVTMGIDIPFTVLKKKDGKIDSVLVREELFNVQLPQKFNKIKLLDSHKKALQDRKEFTDDSSLLFEYNGEVAVVKGSHENVKITNPGDFPIAEEILRNRKYT